jgi:hypothetical protein
MAFIPTRIEVKLHGVAAGPVPEKQKPLLNAAVNGMWRREFAEKEYE